MCYNNYDNEVINLKMCTQCFSILKNNVQVCPKCKSTSFKYLFEKDGSTDETIKKQCEEPNQYQPRCPACGSTNVEKISTASKVGAGIAFGVFSLGHISKTFKCKDCGYKF